MIIQTPPPALPEMMTVSAILFAPNLGELSVTLLVRVHETLSRVDALCFISILKRIYYRTTSSNQRELSDVAQATFWDMSNATDFGVLRG